MQILSGITQLSQNTILVDPVNRPLFRSWFSQPYYYLFSIVQLVIVRMKITLKIRQIMETLLKRETLLASIGIKQRLSKRLKMSTKMRLETVETLETLLWVTIFSRNTDIDAISIDAIFKLVRGLTIVGICKTHTVGNGRICLHHKCVLI